MVEGDPAPFVASLGGEVKAHDRFGTASVTLPDGLRVDVVRAEPAGGHDKSEAGHKA